MKKKIIIISFNCDALYRDCSLWSSSNEKETATKDTNTKNEEASNEMTGNT